MLEIQSSPYLFLLWLPTQRPMHLTHAPFFPSLAQPANPLKRSESPKPGPCSCVSLVSQVPIPNPSCSNSS